MFEFLSSDLPIYTPRTEGHDCIMKIDLKPLRDLQEQGILSIQQHPTLPLLIHNYTQRCQWERLWNEHTLQCRGLITDLDGNVVSRPFPKFFNLGEHTAPESLLPPINWRQEFYVSEKMDGSLGIVYSTPQGPRMATRGSFISEQAERGTAMLERFRGREFREFHTYLFEIIYPENRIVLDYGNKEALVLLDIIDNHTGKGLPRNQLEMEAHWLGCEVVQSHALTADDLAAYQSDDTNREGVVVRFEDGTRIKIKLEEYCRLHKLITGVNTRHIWEYLRDGRDINELIDRVPDEFMGWVNDAVRELQTDFDELQTIARMGVLLARKDLGDAPRKDYAARFMQNPKYASLMFLELDKRDITPAIWKVLRPSMAECFAAVDE